jgi:transcriptional regulator with XRE-family HTH domain
MGEKASARQKEKCRNLRLEQRLSLKEISEIVGVSKSSLSLWLKDIPLLDDEKRQKIAKANKGILRPGFRKDRGEQSKFYKAVDVEKMSRLQKAKIAESAVLFRLCVHGFIAYGSAFDGDRTDWIVESPSGKALKIQVKWTKYTGIGLPQVSLKRAEGHNNMVRYGVKDFDFIVGYDFYSDTAYVFSQDELKGHSAMVSVTKESAERWDKLRV